MFCIHSKANNNNEHLECLTSTGPKRLHVLYKYVLSKFNACNTHTHAHTHTHTPVTYQGNETEEKVFKKTRFKRADRGRIADRNRELVPDNWSLVREKVLTTGLCSEAWYSKHSGVSRRAELAGRSVKVKKF